MEIDSLLYNLIEPELQKYRDKIDDGRDDTYTQWVAQTRAKLEESLSPEQLKIADSHIHKLALNNEYIAMIEQIRLLNLGVKIGMQLQKAFDEE